MTHPLSRRKFISNSILGAVAAGAASQLHASTASGAAAKPGGTAETKDALPKGKLGGLEITRLILGTNIITHHIHARDLNFVRTLGRRYNTDEKVLETFKEAEAQGITAFMTHHEERVVKLFKQYRDKEGGKMKWIVAPSPSDAKDVDGFTRAVQSLMDHGVDALYVHGATTDPLIHGGKFAMVAKFVDILKATTLPSGIGMHNIASLKACEAAKLPCDFYLKTFHHLQYASAPRPEQIDHTTPWACAETPNGYWCAKPEETAQLMSTAKQQWIAFKVMAAGAIPPRDAFEYAFKNGADFILAGMFDFEIADDVQTAKHVLARIKDRARPWRG